MNSGWSFASGGRSEKFRYRRLSRSDELLSDCSNVVRVKCAVLLNQSCYSLKFPFKRKPVGPYGAGGTGKEEGF